MAVTISDEDFAFIYATLRRVTLPYGHDEVGPIVSMEAESWKIIERVAIEQGARQKTWEIIERIAIERRIHIVDPDEVLPSFEESPSS